jgi:hypothetical protein
MVLDPLGAQALRRLGQLSGRGGEAKMLWVSLLAIFSYFTCFLLCCAILILSCTQEHFCLVEGVTLEAANIVFDTVAQKVIKDTVKHACLVSTDLYYTEVYCTIRYNICCI